MSTPKFMGESNQPISSLRWVHRDELVANDYNPNHMAPQERRLLKTSLLDTGWTQPIVVCDDGRTIIDGFHRWTISGDPEVAMMTEGYVPIVIAPVDEATRIAATVRHNRARGSHGIDPMSDIVLKLRATGMDDAAISRVLGMEQEEIDRLAEDRGSPDRVASEGEGLGAAWHPGDRQR